MVIWLSAILNYCEKIYDSTTLPVNNLRFVISRPDVFNYNKVVGRPAFENLEHAFRVAREHLGIEPLLDPEGKLIQFQCSVNF